ncbi:cation:proton antiporter [Defluviimonas sp. 20V17]|uniref:Multisubunit potassium/proton antiporter, PhaG subunit n=1 Tax=Allgaiera indica TaxID=765699 RepID=A0AAN4USJ8_9RHOB|nr:Na+/H+ antiporter subunit G [Allgaiera indica]KDB01917.1 cation:proton antiporter [Defluviimonas sp. 20V17]GHE03420.1 Na+/H+ antiporter subunit G [Allgaiera indica]SDX25219.1 multisubunit potassium/proton antiporter, PhaG subunit [Allgaiera indica]
MEMAFEIGVSTLLVIGGALGLIGSYGLIKLPDLMTRLHAPTKTTTLGVGAVLIASMLWFAGRHGQINFHELLISIFLFLTAPLTANFIAKAHLHRTGGYADLPPPGDGAVWAGQQPPEDEQVDEPAILPEEGVGDAL